MCLTKNTYWACHRCGQDISYPAEPPVMYCFRSIINQKCSRVVTNVIVVCDPALCLYCGFHGHEKYDEVEERIRGMSVGQGLLGSQRMKFFWGVDPAEAWESFYRVEQKRLAHGEWRCAEEQFSWKKYHDELTGNSVDKSKLPWLS